MNEQEKRRGSKHLNEMVWFGNVNGSNNDHGSELVSTRYGGALLA